MGDFFAPSTYWKKQNISFGMFGAGHIIIIVAMLAAIVFVVIFAGKIKHESIKKYLIISFFVWAALDIFKLILFLATSGDSYQALREVLPLYMCSLFIYSLPLAAFCHGKLKLIGEYTLCTLCLISGLLTTINCPVLNSYPFGSFYSLHSLLYHATMAVSGVMLIVSGYVKLEIRRFYFPIFPISVLAVFAIIMNNAVNTDYMLMRYAWGTPVLDAIAAKIEQVPQIFLMLFIYVALSFIMTGLAVLFKRSQAKNTAQMQNLRKR